jgi:hypothetical protein
VRTWLYVRIPVRRNPNGWRKTKGFFSLLASIILVMFLWQVLSGQVGSSDSSTQDTAPAGSPSYCKGYIGNDVGQGQIINAMVDRDCPQFHGYRVALYQMQQDYLQNGEPLPAGTEFPWCKVLREDPCVPTPDMTQP